MSSKVTFDVLARSKAVGFDETNRKIAQQAAVAQKAAKDTHLLSTAITTGVAAGIPVVGAAAGAMVGLGGAAAVAVVGVLGIRDAMKEGTVLGKQYQAAFKPLVGEFTQLKQISAQGLFAGINSGVKSLKPLFPVLNKDVALFSSQLGQVAGHVGPGLVSLFTRLNPLFSTVGDQLVKGSRGFQQWAQSSQSVGKFVAYVQVTLPQVEQTIGSLITTISHVAVAGEAFGGTTLTAIRLFSTAINLIPIGALQTIVPLLLGLKVGSTLSAAFNNAGVGISKFSGNLSKGGVVASGASGVFGKLGGVVGKLGPYGVAAGLALGGLSAVLGRSKQSAIEATKRVNDLTEAMRNGGIAAAVWSNAQQTGAATAQKFGVSQQTLVSGITGTEAKFKAAQAEVDRYGKAAQQSTVVNGQFGASQQQISEAQQRLAVDLDRANKGLAESRKEYQAAKEKVQEWAKTQGDSVLAAEIGSDAYKKNAAAVGLTADQYLNAKLAADKHAQSMRDATFEMQVESNAAGLLSQALQGLGGNNLGVAQAATSVATANAAATASLKANHAAIKGTSAAALANQQALQGAASAAIQHGQAIAQQTGSSVKAAAAIRADKAALEDQLRAQGKLTPAVQTYINTLYKIPPFKRTKIDLDDAAARAKAKALATYISTFRPIMEASVHITGAPAAGGHLKQLATGGPVTGGKQYLVNEVGQELFVPNKAGAYLIPGGPQMWKAPATGQIINAATVRGLRNKLGKVANASLAKLPGAASSAVNAVANILPYGSAVTRQLQSEDTQLERTAAKRASVISKLQAGYQKLAAAQKLYSDEVVKVRDAIVGSFDVANAGKDAYGNTTAAGILTDLQTQVQQANRMAADIAALKGKLNASQLQKLAEGGLASLPALDALAAATPEQLKQFNALMTQLNSAGVKAGHSEADSLYLAGINAAKGLIKGLQSQEKALAKQMQRIAKILIDSLNKALGIHSPATATQPPGKYSVLGFVKGIDSSTAHVVAAAARMAGAAVPALSATSSTAGGSASSVSSAGGDTYIFNLNGAVLGRVDQVVEDLAQGFERRSGRGKTLHVKTG